MYLVFDQEVFLWLSFVSSVFLSFSLATFWVIQLPERTKTGLITKSGRTGPNYRMGPDCAGRS